MEDRGTVSGTFVLTPAAGKRLIGKAVAAFPEVQRAAKTGRLMIGNGTTTAYIVEQLLGRPVPRFDYCVGVVTQGKFAENVTAEKALWYWEKGEPRKLPFAEFLDELRAFERDDVFIKGANAVDPFGIAGGLQTNPKGGSWGEALGLVSARGFHCIVPVGMEKLIPSVIEATKRMGQLRLDYSLGDIPGLSPLTGLRVITEIQALEELAGVKATVTCAGGIGGTEGARGFVVEGSEEAVTKAMAIAKEILDEPPITAGQVKWNSRLPEGL